MNQAIAEMLAVTAEAMGRKVSMPQVEVMSRVLEPHLRGIDLHKLQEKILQQCEFFPVPAKILEIAGRKPQAEPTVEEEARFLVDDIIASLNKGQSLYTNFGSEFANWLRDHLNITLFNHQNGLLEVKYLRKGWEVRIADYLRDNKTSEAREALTSGDESPIQLKGIGKEIE
jgi:hypothetical protein